MVNTRLKDYFDLWMIFNSAELDSALLNKAVDATFARRKTQKPNTTPAGLSSDFGLDANKTKQWEAFVKKNQLNTPDLLTVVNFLKQKLPLSEI